MGKIILGIICLLTISLGVSAQESAVVTFEADIIRPIKRGDSTIIKLIDNVSFFHNGAVIQCDSAYRYNDKMMDGFGNVIINKDSTYVYGDKFMYNGNTNIAKVIAPIVKMVDKDAVLYSYNLEFNTLTNRGWYTGGGSMIQKDNEMESENGLYDANSRDVVFRDSVVMHNPDYLMKTDSVVYNMNTEVVTFLSKADIWSTKGEFLTAESGNYSRNSSEYFFRKNAYIMTADQEIWADNMRYVEPTESVYMRDNIQITDTVQQVVAFGDYGYYLGDTKTAMLTDMPSMINYELGSTDSLFMRSDTIFMFTYKKGEFKVDKVGDDSSDDEYGDLSDEELGNAMLKAMQEGKLKHNKMMNDSTAFTSPMVTDSLINTGLVADSLAAMRPDSTFVGMVDVVSRDTVQNPAEVLQDKPDVKKSDDKEVKDKDADKKPSKKERRKKERKPKKKEVVAEEKKAAAPTVSKDTLPAPAQIRPAIDSMFAAKAVQVDSTTIAPTPDPADTVDRVIKAYRNVRMYRSDFQAVCDSMISYSIDSTIRMYIKPVLWNDQNQLTSEYIVAHTRNQAIYKADFIGEPFICEHIEDSMYNQISGKRMESFFVNNTMDHTNIFGNAMTYYYMEDKGEIQGFMTIVSADMTIYMENKQLANIVWRESPEYAIYPLDKIPADQSTFLKGFTWQIDRRPKSRAEISTRQIRPSRREAVAAIVKPVFSITEKMNAEKERLLKNGQWRDRMDDITVDPNKYRDSDFR